MKERREFKESKGFHKGFIAGKKGNFRVRVLSQGKRRPTERDAGMLLEVMSVYLSEQMKEARRFWRMIPDGLGFDEMLEKYPRGSDEFERISSVMIFWETIGSLLKRGLLNRELAFDTFLDAPPWPKVKRFFEERREKENAPLEGENIEFAYELSMKWKKARERRRGSQERPEKGP